MDFYYYTSPRNVEMILFGEQDGKRGLLPLERLMPLSLVKPRDLPKKANEAVISGLLDPFDRAWCRPFFGQNEPLLEQVIRRIQTRGGEGISLLQVSLASDDHAYVANYAARLNPCHNDDSTSLMGRTKQTMQDYWKSAIPLGAYAASNVTHMVPEVICFDIIPVSQIRVVEVFEKDQLINHIRSLGNFSALPPRSQPVPETQGVEPQRHNPLKPERSSHLHLV